MEKRLSTVSAKIPESLEVKAKALAMATDKSLSDLINESLQERVDREYAYAAKLIAALGVNQDLPAR
jgi:predicted transcriptional regulator